MAKLRDGLRVAVLESSKGDQGHLNGNVSKCRHGGIWKMIVQLFLVNLKKTNYSI